MSNLSRDYWWWYVEEVASLGKQGQPISPTTSPKPSDGAAWSSEDMERSFQKVLQERGKWTAFSSIDRDRLEQAKSAQSQQMAVSGHSGQRLWLADLHEMEMSPMYWKGGSHVPLRRALWMAMLGDDEALGGVPCPPEWEHELEKAMVENSAWMEKDDEMDSKEILVQLGGLLSGYLLQLRRGIMTMATLVPAQPLQITRGLMKGIMPASPLRPVRLIRGYTAYYGAVVTAINSPESMAHRNSPPAQTTDSPAPKSSTPTIPPSPYDAVPESLTPKPVKHVFFVVHGIGQKLAEKVGYGFVASVNSLRRYVLASGKSYDLDLEDVYILPIQWRVDLDMGGGYFQPGSDQSRESPEAEFDSLLTAITLPSVPAVRTLATDVTMDVLLYMTPRHFNRIIEACVKELRRAHSLFLAWNTCAEDTKISIIGHSLGSALVADILGVNMEEEMMGMGEVEAGLEACKKRLGFEVENFFCFGSPLPLFMLLKHVKPIACARNPAIHAILAHAKSSYHSDYQSDSSHPKMGFFACRQLYNLFMPYDPVAYRLEPLIVPVHERADILEPVVVPYYKGGITGLKIGMSESLSRTKQEMMEAMNRSLPQWFRSKLGSPDLFITSDPTSPLEEPLSPQFITISLPPHTFANILLAASSKKLGKEEGSHVLIGPV